MRNSRIVCAAFLATIGLDGAAQKKSHQLTGPQGLDGWIELTPVEGYGDLPTKLIVRRHGEIVREVPGTPVIWRWIFLGNDEIAYEGGTLHTFDYCTRVNIRNGRKLQELDCSQLPLPKRAPQWVKQLRATP